MKYEISNPSKTYNVGNDDTKAIFDAVITGMAIDEAARAQVQGYAEYPFNDEEYDAYWNIDQAAKAFAVAFREDVKDNATYLWEIHRSGNSEVKYLRDETDEDCGDVRVLEFYGEEITIYTGDDTEDDVVILRKSLAV